MQRATEETKKDTMADFAFSRISAHSKVNFTKLNEIEKSIRYENMLKELISMRQKYKRLIKRTSDQDLASESV